MGGGATIADAGVERQGCGDAVGGVEQEDGVGGEGGRWEGLEGEEGGVGAD